MNDPEILKDNEIAAWVAANDGVILFHKKLCPHCKVMGTVLRKAQAIEPTIRLATVDSEEEPGALNMWDVERVPTILVCKGGKVLARKNGIMNPTEFIGFYEAQ